MRRSLDTYRLPPEWHPDNPGSVEHLNRILVEIGQRIDTLQQIGTKKPITPQNVTATGRQGLVWLTWSRVDKVDGYSVVVSTSSDLSKILHRQDIPGSETCTFQFPVGNNATTYFFQVYSYRGNLYSPPSNIVSAASVAFGAGEGAPPAPPVDPRNPLKAPLRNGTTL